MAVSSNTLFHFTRDYDTLTKILKGMSFWPRYCQEFGWNSSFAVPMTCFCDIPLSQIKNHIDTYGSYGIGMSKEFAIKNEINPIFYVTKASLSLFALLTKSGNVSRKEKVRKAIVRIKPYESWNIIRENRIENYKYYDEREWRYVPTKLSLDNLCIKIDKNTNINEFHHLTNNEDCKLKFSSEDVDYLFVKSENKRKELISFIDREMQLQNQERDLFISKILTESQILNDF